MSRAQVCQFRLEAFKLRPVEYQLNRSPTEIGAARDMPMALAGKIDKREAIENMVIIGSGPAGYALNKLAI